MWHERKVTFKVKQETNERQEALTERKTPRRQLTLVEAFIFLGDIIIYFFFVLFKRTLQSL